MARTPSKRSPPPLPRWRLPEVTSEAAVAAVAVFLSVVTLSTSAWFALRGSVVTALPPDSVFFYRDAGGGAVLTAGVDTALVNAASSNYGDSVTRVSMEVVGTTGTNPAFDYENLVTPVFSETAERQAENCPVTARCVRNGQFLVIEEPRRTLDVPGGSSRSEYIGFLMHDTNCSMRGACVGFADFETAARRLDRGQILTLRFHYFMQSDGEKIAECRINLHLDRSRPYRPWLARHLIDKGWVGLPCDR